MFRRIEEPAVLLGLQHVIVVGRGAFEHRREIVALICCCPLQRIRRLDLEPKLLLLFFLDVVLNNVKILRHTLLPVRRLHPIKIITAIILREGTPNRLARVKLTLLPLEKLLIRCHAQPLHDRILDRLFVDEAAIDRTVIF